MRLDIPAVAAVLVSTVAISAAAPSALASTRHEPGGARPAAAVCAQWNVAGTWKSAATNNYHVTFKITQSGTALRGTAYIPASEAVNSGYSTGTFSGSLKGSHFKIIVVWAPRASDGVRLHGLYTGTVVKNHVVDGFAEDLTTKPTPTPGTWVGSGPTRCVRV